MAKKWPELVVKRPFMSQFHFESEYILHSVIPDTTFNTSHMTQGKTFLKLSFHLAAAEQPPLKNKRRRNTTLAGDAI